MDLNSEFCEFFIISFLCTSFFVPKTQFRYILLFSYKKFAEEKNEAVTYKGSIADIYVWKRYLVSEKFPRISLIIIFAPTPDFFRSLEEADIRKFGNCKSTTSKNVALISWNDWKTFWSLTNANTTTDEDQEKLCYRENHEIYIGLAR